MKEIFLVGSFVELLPQMPLNWVLMLVTLMLLCFLVFLVALLGRLVISLSINNVILQSNCFYNVHLNFSPFNMCICSLWQQAGRAGRRERPSLAVYVAFDGPLYQHFMEYPRKLFGSPVECCRIDAQNKQVSLYFFLLSILVAKL